MTFNNLPPEYGLARVGHQAVPPLYYRWRIRSHLKGRRSSLRRSTRAICRYERDYPSDAKLPKTLAALCKISVKTPQPNEDTLAFAQSLDKADAPPEDMELGKQFAQQVILQSSVMPSAQSPSRRWLQPWPLAFFRYFQPSALQLRHYWAANHPQQRDVAEIN